MEARWVPAGDSGSSYDKLGNLKQIEAPQPAKKNDRLGNLGIDLISLEHPKNLTANKEYVFEVSAGHSEKKTVKVMGEGLNIIGIKKLVNIAIRN